MSCGGCRFEFCWTCLGSYVGYAHLPGARCPERSLFLGLIYFLCVLAIVLKFDYVSPAFYEFHYYSFYYAGATVLVDLYLFTFSAHILLIDQIGNIKRRMAPPPCLARQPSLFRPKLSLALLQIFMLALFFMQLYLLFGVFPRYPFTTSMLKMILAQLLVILAGLGCYFGALAVQAVCKKARPHL